MHIAEKNNIRTYWQKYEHFSENRATLFSKSYSFKIRANLRNKDCMKIFLIPQWFTSTAMKIADHFFRPCRQLKVYAPGLYIKTSQKRLQSKRFLLGHFDENQYAVMF